MKSWLSRAGLAVALASGVSRPVDGQNTEVLRHFAEQMLAVCQPEFADFSCPSLYAPWIQQLHVEGITAVCAGSS